MSKDYILKDTKSKHKYGNMIVSFQYYMDCILYAIKNNDLDMLNDKRLSAIIDMIEEYDFLLSKDYE